MNIAWVARELASGLGVPVLVQDRESAHLPYPAFVYRAWPDKDRSDPLVFDVPQRLAQSQQYVMRRYVRFRLTRARKLLVLTD